MSSGLRAGLSVYGITYTCGFTWAGTARANPNPLDAFALMDLAAGRRLQSIEIPVPRMLPDDAPETIRHARDHAERLGLTITVAGGKVQRDHLLQQLEYARALGAHTVRCVLSGILCGDRRTLPDGWPAVLEAASRELEAAVPTAERYQIALAVENHQDATSEDLLRLCRRFESRYLGITLDTGNPLAVMEEPIAFAERIAPYLRDAHLKDYRIHHAENGARLVRCALGRGVIDFPRLYQIFDAQDWPIARNIELGALHARLIPFLETSWWEHYPARNARDLLPALSLFWNQARPEGEEWRTPLERDDPAEVLAALEREELDASLEYLAAFAVAP